MKFPGFVGPSYTLNDRAYDCQRAINLYLEVHEAGNSKEEQPACLKPSEGLAIAISLGSGPTRGGYVTSGGRSFVVSGNKLYELTSAESSVELGTLDTSSGSVDISDNGTSLVVVDGPNGYWLTLADNTFAKITDPDFLGATTVDYIDGYLIFNNPNTGQFYYTNLNSTVIDALDIQTSEGKPDNIVAIIAKSRELWVGNKDSFEVFYNSGEADAVFSRIQGAFIEIGLLAPFSLQKVGDNLLWLGTDKDGSRQIYFAQGYAPVPISTRPINEMIESLADLEDSVAWTYSITGHQFYAINFPGATTTWVFDLTTKQWHERAHFDAGTFTRHRAQWHIYAFGKHFVGDHENGNIYSLEKSYNFEDVDGPKQMKFQRVFPHASAGSKRVFWNSMEIDFGRGVGDGTDGQGSDPKFMLDWSDDSARTWKGERTAKMGKQGEFKKRARFERMGSSRDRVFRLSFTDRKTTLLGVDVEFEVGAS